MPQTSGKKRQRHANDAELPAEKAPRSQKPWIEQERKATQLPKLGAKTPKASSPKAAQSDAAGVVGKKKAKKMALIQAKFARKEGKKMAADAKALQEKREALRSKKPKQGPGQGRQASEVVTKMLQACTTPEQQQSLLASAAERISAEPEKQLELFEVFFELYQRGVDDRTKQLAILSAMVVIKDLIPGYRIREPTAAEKAMRRSKDVLAVETYEVTLLQTYKRLLPFVEAELKARPESTVPALSALVRVAYDFNYRQRLLANAVRYANCAIQAVRKVIVQALAEMVEVDTRLEATREVVLAIGRMAQSAAAASRHGNTWAAKGAGDGVKGFHKDLFQILLSIRFGKAADVAARTRDTMEETDADVKRGLQEASISQSAEHMQKAEAELLTEIFVVYLRILRQRHLHNSESIGTVLTGLARWSHQVNLELVLEIIQELKGVVQEALGQNDEKVAMQALHCTFIMLSGPSQALMADTTWLPDSFRTALSLVLPSMYCCLSDGVSWPPPKSFSVEKNRLRYSMAEVAAAMEAHSMPCLAIKCMQSALRCDQAFGRASDATLATLVESLFLLSSIADPHAGLPLLREASLLLRRHHRLYTLLDEEGGLFGLGGLLDRAVSVVWFLQAMAFSIVPDLAKAAKSLRKLIPMRSTSLGEMFPMSDNQRWLEAEFARHLAALVVAPKPASKAGAAGKRPWRFATEADLRALNLHRSEVNEP
mmetsp:Transcript_44568/g.102918  ORF Transcript_44568/g.102918 Transcript_44568/m.102918 type:complete len:714 (+) Transcript_44568:41-2182(+)